MKKNNVQKMVMTSLCVAIGLVLPQLLHSVPQAGSILLPMHIPVLLCGLLCGWAWGLGCGVLTPLLSSLILGMPPAPYLPGMLVELATYALIAGLLYRTFKLNIYVALLCAMLAGRVAYGLLQTVMFLAGGSAYSFQIFFTGLFVKGLPGIAIQIVLIPLLVLALEKAGVSQKPKLA
ncbi:ECF transporter S component [Ruminococcaceae bacterium OttesenSCG-928-A16]|nr:ECF transporter S component [Ruminococcaceae bacterium OttesenSCG-928-A16]